MPWVPAIYDEPRIEKAPPAFVQHQHPNTNDRVQTFGELIVTAEVSEFDPNSNVFTFRKGVIAKFGVTTVSADELIVDMNAQRANAQGNVTVHDPDASLTTKNLDFSWATGARTAHAENVRVVLGHIVIEAEQADLTEQRWDFVNVQVTQCPDYYWIHSPHVVVTPGKKATMQKPTLELFGKKIITLPNQSYNLNPKTQGIKLPSISYSGGTQFGIDWDTGILIDDRTNFYATASSSFGSYPGYGAILTRSAVTKSGPNSIVTPSSDLGERFRFGYLDNVSIDSPEEELNILNSERKSVSIASLFNQSVSGRRETDRRVSKPYEVILEYGGQAGQIGFLSQLRMQRIYELGGDSATRGVLKGSVELPSKQIGPKLRSLERVDTEQYFGGEQYGWVRGQLGAAYQATDRIRIAAALVGTVEYGRETFSFDRPVQREGANFRFDFDLGPTKVSYLQKYDTRLKWYDREISFSQVAGCFEPYFVQRQFPRSFVFGVKLRTGNFDQLLHRTSENRPETATSVISSDGHP
jgi:hypothetical protein